MMDQVSRSCKAEDLALCTYSGILRPSKSCLQLPEYHRVLWCETDTGCFQNMLPSLVKANAKQVLSAESNTASSKEEVEIIKVFVRKFAAL